MNEVNLINDVDDLAQDVYGVYIRVDNTMRIIAINSDAFLSDLIDWIKIDEGYGDRYHHAQGNYFTKSLMDERGIYRYKLEDGVVVERTQEEMNADYREIESTPTQEDRIAALEEENKMLTECLLEMSEILYA